MPFKYLRLVRAVARDSSNENIALKTLAIFAKYQKPWIASLISGNAMEVLANPRGRHKILIIKKAVFTEDILDSIEDSNDICVYGVNRAVIKALALGILPKSICADDKYLTNDSTINNAKLRYRKFLQRVLSSWVRRFGFEAIVTGNWAYWAERELAAASTTLDIPFIVLHKEGIKPPARSKLLRDLFMKTRGQFMGSDMLVYQQDEKEHQVEGGITDEDAITIVGMPRMDKLHAWRRDIQICDADRYSSRPVVLFLAFLPNNFLPCYSDLEDDRLWTDLCRGSLLAMIELGRRRKDISILIRPRIQELAEIENIVGDLTNEEGLPENISIQCRGRIEDSIKAAWVVVGHNSTGLLEAIAAGKEVVQPHFGECLDSRYAGYIVDLGDSVGYADSPRSLEDKVESFCNKRPIFDHNLTDSQQKALQKWTGNADGLACKRVERAIRGVLKRTSSH